MMNMFHKDSEQIYKISGWGCPYALAPTIAERVPEIEALNAKIQEVVRKNGNLQYEVERVVCYPLSDVYFNYADLFTAFKSGNHKQVMAMIWVGIIILLPAIVNFFNLSAAQGMVRAKEIGLRKVNGATRRMLITQFLGESIAMTLCAMVLALIIVNLLMPFFSSLVGIRYPFIWMSHLWQWRYWSAGH